MAGTPTHLGRSAVVLAGAQHECVDAQTAEAPCQPLQHVVAHHTEGPGRHRRGSALTLGHGHLQQSPAQQPATPLAPPALWGPRPQGLWGTSFFLFFYFKRES